jgi:hypothetical protein
MLAPKGQKRQKNQAPAKPKTTNTVEEIPLHGNSINFTAARVSDTRSRIRHHWRNDRRLQDRRAWRSA